MTTIEQQEIIRIKEHADFNNINNTIFDEMYKQKITMYAMQKTLEAAGHTIGRDPLYRWAKHDSRLNCETLNMMCAVLGLRLTTTKEDDQ